MMIRRSFPFLVPVVLLFLLCTASGASAATATFSSLLKVGSSGAEVTALQKALTAQGAYSGPITGQFGSLTQAAVKKFQAAHKIDAVGYTGPATRAALNGLKAAGTSVTTTAAAPAASSGSSLAAQIAALQAMVASLQAQLAGGSTSPSTSVTASTSVKPTPSNGGQFEVSGWIPYWAEAKAVADVTPHLSELTEINPFGFSVKTDGTLADTLNVTDPTWQALFAQAHAQGVRVVATVMWSDTGSIHTVLSNPTLRAQHIQSIVSTINKYGFDGVDIDYEGKLAADKDNYSAFLRELNAALAANGTNKWLECTIEARTPPDSLNTTVSPSDIQYANDYTVINQYCDRVRLMTYDQESADASLNASHQGQLYSPIADPAWIKKVIALTTQTIDKSKIELGVATYGYIYQVMPSTDGSSYDYTLLEAFNPAYATQTAAQYNIMPSRNAAGELSFTYVPKETVSALPSNSYLSSLAPSGTDSSNLAAAGALALAKSSAKQSPVQLLWWSDAQAIQDKVNLAKQLGLRGVSIFKLDGGEDPNMWNVLSGAKQ
ncbi:MAG TPA: glycosyl hydrolase family 18 protein [Candidatus Paceibacterota bacterium]|nr:glycosyl hydrolase family 18 protein [Candidatus Paceibacterota bacterium]